MLGHIVIASFAFENYQTIFKSGCIIFDTENVSVIQFLSLLTSI